MGIMKTKNKTKEKSYLKETSEIKYILLDDNKFDDQGNIKTLRDIFRDINGKIYTFEDGSFFKVIKKVGKINIYDEFMKKLPASNISDKQLLREINKLISINSDEILGNTKYDCVEKDHHKDKHHASGLYVTGFDRRSVNIFNKNTGDVYELLISVADLVNGDKVLYAKKYLYKKEKISSVKDQGHLLKIISQIKAKLSSIISK